MTEQDITPPMVRADSGSTGTGAVDARERILGAAEELFAESGFDATPTSRIAERAEVPKGLVHYYFRRKQDLLTALVERLPDETVDSQAVAIPGDLRASLGRLVRELDAKLQSSLLLSHLLWREADTHVAIQHALERRFRALVEQIRRVIDVAMPKGLARASVDSASVLLARAVSYRHAVARHGDQADELDREVAFVARALELGSDEPA